MTMNKMKLLLHKLHKISQILCLFIFVGAIILLFHQQINGHQYERKECWKIGGVLWHTMNGDLVCIKPSPGG